MSLIQAAVWISAVIFICAALPELVPAVRRLARPLRYAGTIVLSAVCVFEIIPEMYEEAGALSLVLMCLVWGGVYLTHAIRHGFSAHSHEHGDDFEAAKALVFAMSLHCIAGGLFLVTAYEVSQDLAYGLFLGLVGHKAFEAISVSSTIMEKVKDRGKFLTLLGIYAVSFPVSVALAYGVKVAFAGQASESAIHFTATILGSIAMGSLFGCLLHHFLIPSLKEVGTVISEKFVQATAMKKRG